MVETKMVQVWRAGPGARWRRLPEQAWRDAAVLELRREAMCYELPCGAARDPETGVVGERCAFHEKYDAGDGSYEEAIRGRMAEIRARAGTPGGDE